MADNLKDGDIICRINRNGIISKKQTVISIGAREAKTDLGLRILKSPFIDGYREVGTGDTFNFWTEEKQKVSDARAAKNALVYKVQNYFAVNSLHNLSADLLQNICDTLKI